MKVLLPVCGLDDGNLIIDFVSRYQWPKETQFEVLHVVGGIGTNESAREMVTNISNRLKFLLREAEIRAKVCSGAAIHEITDEALRWQASMIVMGYRIRPTVEPSLARSVSRSVSIQAPCPVVTIRPEFVTAFENCDRTVETVDERVPAYR
ncbi:MAG: universal stress protein [Cyanobacteria bacterium]|nr:universal stress protein [Cyanobacteriota bacterium]